MAAAERGDLTRDRIITAAATLFSKQGFTNTSLTEILSAADITKGGFYFHFRSKEELGLAVIDTIARTWVEKVLAEAVREKDPLRRIHRMFELEDRLAAEAEFSGYLLIAVLTAEMTDSDTGFMDRLRMLFDEWHSSVKRMIDRGIERGLFRRDIDSDGLAMLIVSAVEGLSLLAQLDRSGKRYKCMMKSLKKNLQYMLVP